MKSSHNSFPEFSFTRPPERERGRVGENTRNEVGMGSESFHMKSRSLYWCSKSIEKAAILEIHTYPVGVETVLLLQ